MDWSNATKIDGGIAIPEKWLFLHYYEALTILFRVENSLRLFVFAILKNSLSEKWSEISIKSDDTNETTISSLARKRLGQAENFGYLGHSVACPLMHLTSGELSRLILSDSYWRHFNKYFSANREVVRLKLEEIGVIRNSLAHFRPIRPDDVAVVKENARQMLGRVEQALYSMMNCIDPVPSNSQDAWYLSLHGMKNETCSLSLTQSQDEGWISVDLHFRPSQTSERTIGKFRKRIGILNLVPQYALRAAEPIRNLVVFVSEGNQEEVDDTGHCSFRKYVSFIFSKDVLAARHEDLKTAFGTLLDQIKDDVALLSKDALARGKVLRLTQFDVWRQLPAAGSANPPRWRLSGSLASPPAPQDPPEYWGNTTTYRKDLVSDSESFPWMPVKISESDIPF